MRILALLFLCASVAAPANLGKGVSGGELRFSLHDEPKSLDPWLMDGDPAEAVRYLTEGVLIRINRRTQQPEPELASSWKVSKDGKRIEFQLRRGVTYPGGASFTSKDVVATFQRLLDPVLHAPVADAFKFDKQTATVSALGDFTVIAEFPVPVPGIERLFDLIAIVSAQAATRPAPGLGPFLIAERKPGTAIFLKRNPSYWKRDTEGKPLPRVDSIRLDIQQNRDLELLRFRLGETHLIDTLTPDLFERLAAEMPGVPIDAGPTLDSDFLWFNQAAKSPLPEYKKQWFRSEGFRRAVSQAINRADLCRLVYRGHASPAAGPVSPANKLWYNSTIKPDAVDVAAALKRLTAEGFRQNGGTLVDRKGNPVEFSIITNAGNKAREMMAAMIQQDLAKLGIKLNIVTLDFPSLIARITRSFDYEACLLGFVNVDGDPNGMMNIFLSSASNHPWNPSQKTPATEWEAEMDRLMLAQASTPDRLARKKSFDRVLEILHDKAPIVYLVHPNSLSAVSPQVIGVKSSAFYPHTFWDAERLMLTAAVGSRR